MLPPGPRLRCPAVLPLAGWLPLGHRLPGPHRQGVEHYVGLCAGGRPAGPPALGVGCGLLGGRRLPGVRQLRPDGAVVGRQFRLMREDVQLAPGPGADVCAQ